MKELEIGRLRSELTADVSRSQRVMRNCAAAQQHREALIAKFREALSRQLNLNGSAAEEALLLSASSTYVEISVISARFLRSAAGSAEMERLEDGSGL